MGRGRRRRRNGLSGAVPCHSLQPPAKESVGELPTFRQTAKTADRSSVGGAARRGGTAARAGQGRQPGCRETPPAGRRADLALARPRPTTAGRLRGQHPKKIVPFVPRLLGLRGPARPLPTLPVRTTPDADSQSALFPTRPKAPATAATTRGASRPVTAACARRPAQLSGSARRRRRRQPGRRLVLPRRCALIRGPVGVAEWGPSGGRPLCQEIPCATPVAQGVTASSPWTTSPCAASTPTLRHLHTRAAPLRTVPQNARPTGTPCARARPPQPARIGADPGPGAGGRVWVSRASKPCLPKQRPGKRGVDAKEGPLPKVRIRARFRAGFFGFPSPQQRQQVGALVLECAVGQIVEGLREAPALLLHRQPDLEPLPQRVLSPVSSAALALIAGWTRSPGSPSR
jgi:hypothetical protein